MKRYLFPITIIILTLVFYLWSPFENDKEVGVYTEKEGQILLPQKNVAIVILDLKKAGLSFTRASDMKQIRNLHNDLLLSEGVSKIESILNASRVISENDDIIVSKAIPKDDADLTDAYLKTLAAEIEDFPELSPYVNRGQNTLLFYIYYGNNMPAQDIYKGLRSIQNKWQESIPIEFTGRGPVIAETEALLTKDVILFFPLLGIMVIAVFAFFRSVRAVVSSIVLILISMVTSYGFVRFLGIDNSPLILLIPVFSLGLLSDYLIHYFYHHLHTPRLEGQAKLRNLLLFPLSLTALSTLTGFLSLSLIKGSGHLQLGVIISTAVVITWFGVFFWLDYRTSPEKTKHPLANYQYQQGRIFSRIVKIRYGFFIAIIAMMAWGIIQLSNLTIEPYPIEQLPASTTIKKADDTINQEFYGTIPFFIEVDTGEKSGILKKSTLLNLNDIHMKMQDSNVGYSFSFLTVLKRMNYYFMGSEDSLLTSSEFDDFYDAFIEQYLLYYSSSVDPLEYESLLDNSYRFFSIKGLIHYQNYEDLSNFYRLINEIERDAPGNWSLSVHGMAEQLEAEHSNLRGNWVLSFLGGSFLIFITVLVFYKKLSLAFLSLLPGVISMIISFGIISAAGISIDVFSIIFVAIITGLVIDYSVHTLVALNQIKEVKSLEEGFSSVIGFSGIPIFLSFLTSLLSFSVLLLSSFRGARNLGFLLLTSLVLSFFLSLYLIPLIILPIRLKRESKNV